MQRILIVGSSGAGKTTLAIRLGEKLSLPLLHLDQYYWQPGWQEPSVFQWRETVSALIQAERWVMDGNYGGTLDLRIPRADTIIWLDYSHWRCLWQVCKRTLRYWGRTRPDMPEGCPERFEREFLWYVYQFPRQHRPRLVRHLSLAKDQQILQFRHPGELKLWLSR